MLTPIDAKLKVTLLFFNGVATSQRQALLGQQKIKSTLGITQYMERQKADLYCPLSRQFMGEQIIRLRRLSIGV
ncbi:hypothetical protein BCU68_10795 [Vibrio sp. 10N.286.49.B3]|nr:hypothetical protein BCU68_10795 [Vibrio sp. 10N.286.49.B3]